MDAPFLTGPALRDHLRGSATVRAEAAVTGETEDQVLDRMVSIAEAAKEHWAGFERNDANDFAALGIHMPGVTDGSCG